MDEFQHIGTGSFVIAKEEASDEYSITTKSQMKLGLILHTKNKLSSNDSQKEDIYIMPIFPNGHLLEILDNYDSNNKLDLGEDSKTGIRSVTTYGVNHHYFEPLNVEHYNDIKNEVNSLSTSIRDVLISLFDCAVYNMDFGDVDGFKALNGFPYAALDQLKSFLLGANPIFKKGDKVQIVSSLSHKDVSNFTNSTVENVSVDGKMIMVKSSNGDIGFFTPFDLLLTSQIKVQEQLRKNRLAAKSVK